jgi:hypothetical protein
VVAWRVDFSADADVWRWWRVQTIGIHIDMVDSILRTRLKAAWPHLLQNTNEAVSGRTAQRFSGAHGCAQPTARVSSRNSRETLQLLI